MRLWKVWHGASVPRVGQAPPPFGPGMSTIYLREATRLERWESEWDDERDQTEWRLYRGTTLVETRRVTGFSSGDRGFEKMVAADSGNGSSAHGSADHKMPLVGVMGRY